MTYIDNFGKAAGPIKIGATGPWLIQNKIRPQDQEFPVKYLTFSDTVTLTGDTTHGESFNRSDDLVTLRARTPLLGTYSSGSGNLPFADLNAVATVKWVMAYTSLNPGERPIDLDSYVDYTVFNSALIRITQLESDTDTIDDKLTTLTIEFNRYVEHADELFVSHLADGFDLWKSQVNNYMENPFPYGLLLQCGSALTTGGSN